MKSSCVDLVETLGWSDQVSLGKEMVTGRIQDCSELIGIYYDERLF